MSIHSMTLERLYGELEELLGRIGVILRADDFDEEQSTDGGLCRIKGHPVLILDRRLALDQKIILIVRCLRGLDVETLYLKPYLRDMIDGPSPSLHSLTRW